MAGSISALTIEVTPKESFRMIMPVKTITNQTKVALCEKAGFILEIKFSRYLVIITPCIRLNLDKLRRIAYAI